MININKTSTILIFVSFTFVLISFFLIAPAFSELKKASGVVSFVSLKENGVGAFVELTLIDSAKSILLNISSLNEEANIEVRSFEGGEHLEAWYSDAVPLKGGSYDVWQLSLEGRPIFRYQDTLRVNNVYIYLLLILATLMLVCSLLICYRSRGSESLDR